MKIHPVTFGVSMLMLWSAIVALGANKTFMLHGWTSTPSAFTTISNLLVTNGGWAPGDIVFSDYSTEPNTRTIEELAYKIASDMQMAYSANGNQPIDFVAHSQGGLILRVILAGRDRNPSRPYDSRGFKPACIRRIITLATPHYGHNRASNPLPSVASEVQRQEMYVGGGFLWDLACDWRDVTKKIPDANFLCVVAMPDADTVNVNAFVNRDDDGIVPIWAAALGACEARYVVRVHAQVIRLFGNWFGLGNAGIEECPGGGNDEVYLLIRDFLGHGTVRSQAQCGLPNPQLPDGTLLVRVFNAYGTPVAYSGNIIAGVLPGATLILYHGQGDWQAAGVEQLGPLAAGNYTLLTSDSTSNYYPAFATESVLVTGGRATVCALLAPSADSDQDGMPDDWERLHGLVVDVNDAGEDPDHDGADNYQEYAAGTDPHDAKSSLRLEWVRGVGLVPIEIRWPTVPGRTYVVQCKESLADPGVWDNAPGAITIMGDGGIKTYSAAPALTRLFRVQVRIAPRSQPDVLSRVPVPNSITCFRE